MVVHKFLPNSSEDITRLMLQKLGLQGVDELFSDVPDDVRLKSPMKIPTALSDFELERFVDSKLSKNASAPEYLSFLGGGNWLHYVPSVIDEILSRGEFYTAYTPYQPEISQGMLQGLFEYQSQICELTGMDVANSSMYDWGTALGEAGRMAHRIKGRSRILAGGNVSPDRLEVLRTYLYPLGMNVEVVDYDRSGRLDLNSLRSKLNDDVSAVYFENPNFFGIIEDSADEISQICHSKGAIVIVGVNPMTLGLLRPPGSYDADIVVGDGQPLGLYPNFGGPLIGMFATRRDPTFLRQMPGRLIGMTTSKDRTARGFTMVLQTREQHIRREHATSNICTNEALFALAVSIYLTLMGPQGMKQIGEKIVANSHYATKRLAEESIDARFFDGPFFGEVSVKTSASSIELAHRLAYKKILGGLPLGRFYDNLKDVSIFSFSEIHTSSDIEHLVSSVKEIEREKH